MVKHEDIKKEVEKFTEENGNSNIPMKDLLIYAINRLDALPCDKHLGIVTKAVEGVKWLKWIVGIGLPTLFVFICTLHFT